MSGARCALPTSWMTWTAGFFLVAASGLSASAAIHPGALDIPSAHGPDIRVKIDQLDVRTVSVTGVALRISGVPLLRDANYRAVRISWKFSKDGWHEWSLEDRDSGEPLTKMQTTSLDISGQNLRLGLRPIAGRLRLHPANLKQIDVISSVDLESYVRGVLPAEMPSAWPMEALKAQAIAARSFALSRRHLRGEAAFDLEASVMDQMYLAPNGESDGAVSLARGDQAVRETAGQILVNPAAADPVALAAYFHADCGGRTEEAAVVWGSGGVGTAIDGACPLNPHGKWHTSFSARELLRLLGTGAQREILALEPSGRTKSGRLEQIKVVWNEGAPSWIPAHEFRMALGHDRVKSTNFRVTHATNGDFEFTGQGYGHGVGMCQWGARHLAITGKNYREILVHYYPRAKLSRLAEIL